MTNSVVIVKKDGGLLAVEKIYPFLPLFGGFLSTFTGAGLSDNLANLLVGFSFATPLLELTFRLAIPAAGQVRVGARGPGPAKREPLRSWAARQLLQLPPPELLGPA
ncbi:hypothetical protein PAL_GLEAN10000874 [Pteropus alecto]|uniref:Uncharacterized protein n=1 Tax=Pteropus alecto TaxID=9402 RepID=L5KAH1_PTEAL|nr:hypothetical protein PAL_GLEAN10000874 [Pteropus alecto]